MTAFAKFEKTYGPGSDCRPAPVAAIDKFGARLPPQLVQHWRESGWCSYGDGLIWTINPDDLIDVLDDWLGPDHGAIPFCRSPFADVFLWHDGAVKSFAVQFGKLNKIMSNIEPFFDGLLCDKSYVNDMLLRKLFRQALKKLGPLKFDECYGFQPVLALGGSGEIDTVVKVKMREYLGILSQVVEVEANPFRQG
ncbi:MAG TPA: T6SS immunity protein Tdi1 domain-containing protein [Bradyrhizobium sp.]|jgi:hypothetical protein|nr:T6SS immunity protein Tdi1 domain-containing protein [Bradyrhizobium sp.]